MLLDAEEAAAPSGGLSGDWSPDGSGVFAKLRFFLVFLAGAIRRSRYPDWHRDAPRCDLDAACCDALYLSIASLRRSSWSSSALVARQVEDRRRLSRSPGARCRRMCWCSRCWRRGSDRAACSAAQGLATARVSGIVAVGRRVDRNRARLLLRAPRAAHREIHDARHPGVALRPDARVLGTIVVVIAYTTIAAYQFRGGGRLLNLVRRHRHRAPARSSRWRFASSIRRSPACCRWPISMSATASR